MTFPLKTILIDDEALAINRLRRLLDKHRDTFEVIGEAANGAEGLTLIEAERPDIIFLDIEMPLLNGFEMLAKVTAVPLVIFATAFNQYAIRAFEENSVDYLLKPSKRIGWLARRRKSEHWPNETIQVSLSIIR